MTADIELRFHLVNSSLMLVPMALGRKLVHIVISCHCVVDVLQLGLRVAGERILGSKWLYTDELMRHGQTERVFTFSDNAIATSSHEALHYWSRARGCGFILEISLAFLELQTARF